MVKAKKNTKKKIEERISKSKIVSPRLAKRSKKSLAQSVFVKEIISFFSEDIRKEFLIFLEEKTRTKSNKGIRSKNKSSKLKKEYKKEGSEPISFKEVTSYRNPLFSAGGPESPEEYNPETIDVDTFDLMRRDQQLAAGLAIIKLPIVALPWRIVCDDEKIAKTVEWAISKIWRNLIKSSLLAVDYGFASHEKVWERDSVKISHIDKEGGEEIYYEGDLVYYKKIKPHHPSSIKIKFDEYQNVEEIIQESSIGEDIHLPIRKCFLFTNDKEFGNPFGVSRLKNAYKVWFWKELLYQFMMQYFERRGTPPTIATAPPGKSQDSVGTEISNLELALRLASSLISTSVAVLPYQQSKDGKENMWKLELLNDDARGPMFIEALQHLDARCLRSIFVPESIFTQEGGGGYAGSSIHADLFLMSEKGLITDIEESVNEQIITPFVEANFLPEKIKPCGIKLDPLDWNRKIALKEIFSELIRNIDTMIQMGIAPNIIPNIEKMAEILEIPVQTWEEMTGISAEELLERTVTTESNEKKKEEDDKKIKKKGRKVPRKKSVDQTSDRKRINPGGRRGDRARKTDTTKKSNE